MRIGKWEKEVLVLISKTPEYIRTGVLHPHITDYYGAYMFEDAILMAEKGLYVHTSHIKWWFQGAAICRSTLSRTLTTLEKKELIYARELSGSLPEDNLALGKYRKFYSLTESGRDLAKTLTSEFLQC